MPPVTLETLTSPIYKMRTTANPRAQNVLWCGSAHILLSETTKVVIIIKTKNKNEKL